MPPLDGEMARSHFKRDCSMGDIVGIIFGKKKIYHSSTALLWQRIMEANIFLSHGPFFLAALLSILSGSSCNHTGIGKS